MPTPSNRILFQPELSCHREQLLQHEFVGAILKDAWFRRDQAVEILWPEVDFAGYDVVLSCNGVTRQVQLKSSNSNGKVRKQKINLSLADAASGCVVWSVAKEVTDGDPPVIDMRYRVFGGLPGARLTDLTTFPIAKHTKGNALGVKAERPNIREVPITAFRLFDKISAVSDWLFGPRGG